ncbi:MAG: nucleoside deaminase [Chitinophagales bacterium]|nr:nucleoside deaminase [Chitinophagales bacterium]
MVELNHSHFMSLAIKEALKAYEEDEVPIGCVIISQNQVIAKGYNQTQRLNDATAHAEIIALTSAFNYLNSKILKDCIMYVTIEPCAMCAGAIRWAQIGGLVYGATEDKCGFTLYKPSLLHPKTEVIAGIEKDTCAKLIKDFFMDKRA